MRTLFILGFLAAMAATASAAALERPTGEILLTVSGNITETNGNGVANFDMSMLDAIAQRVTTTKTPWFDTEVTFKGPIGSELLKAVGATGTIVHVSAINDYSADIPMEDFLKNPVIFATTLNGKPMSVRDKGPIFVIYPFDLDPNLYNEQYFGRSVWQVTSIEVR